MKRAFRILSVVGTRPEVIKMAPVIRRLANEPMVESRVCITAQHRGMLDSALQVFDIRPDYELNVMTSGKGLSYVCSAILNRLQHVLAEFRPDRILVQGDTATTFAASLAAFYKGIPVAHIEVGLRSENLYAPWPEEANRRLTSIITDLDFAPTAQAATNLHSEGVPSNKVIVTGNTVVDALLCVSALLEDDTSLRLRMESQFSWINLHKRLVLITGHRRENFGERIKGICNTLLNLSERNDVQVCYVVHLNPNVRMPVRRILRKAPQIKLLRSAGLPEFRLSYETRPPANYRLGRCAGRGPAAR
jgi:UDP-N-acetylglucosamine 2-epimerase (non-hydrolysing)